MPTATALITADQLARIVPQAPRAHVTGWLPYLNEAMAAEQINTNRRVAAFIGQITVETRYLNTMDEEGGNAYFTRMYEGKKVLGNTHKGDGIRFHGRGAIQITGRWNYTYLGRVMRIDLVGHPEQLAAPDPGIRVSARYWTFKHCNPFADKWDLWNLTHRVNSARDQYQLRARISNVALSVLERGHPG